jgi:hypothetical protein
MYSSEKPIDRNISEFFPGIEFIRMNSVLSGKERGRGDGDTRYLQMQR